MASTSYDAISDTNNKRKPIKRKTYSEDSILTAKRRTQLAATTRDAIRNFSLVSWVVRKHLDYVSDFSFRATCLDHEEFGEQLEKYIKENPNEKLWIIAFSKGGVDALHFLNSNKNSGSNKKASQ